MAFRHLVGHKHLTALLARAVGRDSLPPSLIFAGPRGVGKHATALALAQLVNCQRPHPEPEPDACGTCPSCERIARGAHPDVLTLRPGDTGSIKIETVREAIDQTAYRPFEGRRRIVIIDEAQALVAPAQSALLKTLEEPSRTSMFVLVTASPDALLPTVRSRCPSLRFGYLPEADIAAVLMRQHDYSEADALSAATLAGGSIGRALEAATDEVRAAREAARRLLLTAAAGGGAKPRLAGASDLTQGGARTAGAARDRLARRLVALSSLIRDLQALAVRVRSDLVVNRDVSSELEALSGAFDQPRLGRAHAAVVRALDALDRNASPKIVADWVALQL